MSAPIITDLDLASWMREASRQTDPVGYLDGLNRSATIAVAAGDEYVTIVSGESGSQTANREISARFLQHITELCLQRHEAAAAAGGFANLPPPGADRFATFSHC